MGGKLHYPSQQNPTINDIFNTSLLFVILGWLQQGIYRETTSYIVNFPFNDIINFSFPDMKKDKFVIYP